MSEEHKMRGQGRKRTNIWMVIGVVVLIVLLFVWLTVADFTGDTDVAAFIANTAML